MSARTLYEHAANCKVISDRVRDLRSLVDPRTFSASNLWRLHVDGSLWPGPWNTTRSIREVLRKMTAEDLDQNIQGKGSSWRFYSQQAFIDRSAGKEVTKSNFYVEHTFPCEHLKDQLIKKLLKEDLNVEEIAKWVLDNQVVCLLVKGQELGIGKFPNYDYPFKRYPFKVVNEEGHDVSAYSRIQIIEYLQSKYVALRQQLSTFKEEEILNQQKEFLESGRPKEILRDASWYAQSRQQQFEEAYHDFKSNYIRDYYKYGN